MNRGTAVAQPVDLEALEACKQISDPLVSVGMLVYNQRRYIRSAIESVLLQEVDFNYEIIIADDCSTDGTRDIVIEYAEKYPQIIRLILQEENVGLLENSKCLKRACRGRYRATQEGDDYWLDTDRLQKQVNFLDENPDYIAVCGNLIAADENSRPCEFPWGGLSNTYKLEGDYEKEDIENWKMPSHAGAWLSYNLFSFLNQEYFDAYESYSVTGDRKTPMYMMLYGKIRILPDVFMVRRILWRSKTSHMNTYRNRSATARVFNWAKETERMDSEFLHLGLDMSETLDSMFLKTFGEFAKKPSRLLLSTCSSIFWHSGRKLHYFALLNKKLAVKFHNKLKKEGFFGGLLNSVKFLLKSVKKVLFKS